MTKQLDEYTYQERMAMPGLTVYEQLYGRHEHDVKRELLATMKRLGAHKIEATYSGGHDEGGVQDFEAWNGAGELLMPHDENREDYDKLVRACDEVLSTKFFSWALGCSVSGTLYVDLATKRAWTSGSIEEWVDDKDPLEWKL